MPAVDKSVLRLLRVAWRGVASICFGLFWLPRPYLPRSDVIRSHSARAVRHYEIRVCWWLHRDRDRRRRCWWQGWRNTNSGGDGSFEQFSVDGHAIMLVWKWWMQDDFTSGKWWRHGWTWRCEEMQNGKNVEQTKIWQGWRNTNLRRWQFWAVQFGWPCYIACVKMVNAGWFYFEGNAGGMVELGDVKKRKKVKM